LASISNSPAVSRGLVPHTYSYSISTQNCLIDYLQIGADEDKRKFKENPSVLLGAKEMAGHRGKKGTSGWRSGQLAAQQNWRVSLKN
jgi:hypothetical protein